MNTFAPFSCHVPRYYQRGFTLLEMVVSIVIMGIIASTISVFMLGPIRGYFDAEQRAELSDVADLALRRIDRDVRQALPNSIRCGSASGLCATISYGGLDYYFVEFIPTAGGGSYRDVHDGSAGGHPLNFVDMTSCAAKPENCRFDVIGTMPSDPAITVGDFIVVLNFGEVSGVSQAPFNAYASGDLCSNCNRAQVTGVAGNTVTLKPLASGGNVFARAEGGGRSDSDNSNRFHVVSQQQRTVMYACPANVPGPLLRFENYGFNTTLAAAITAAQATTPEVLAIRAECTISYAAQATLQRTGMLSVELTLSHVTKSQNDVESMTLLRQIHTDNSP